RDFHVTGVQTCALPIWRQVQGDFGVVEHGGRRTSRAARTALLSRSLVRHAEERRQLRARIRSRDRYVRKQGAIEIRRVLQACVRSEERRVGKGGEPGLA